jgi:hypothetical protein
VCPREARAPQLEEVVQLIGLADADDLLRRLVREGLQVFVEDRNQALVGRKMIDLVLEDVEQEIAVGDASLHLHAEQRVGVECLVEGVAGGDEVRVGQLGRALAQPSRLRRVAGLCGRVGLPQGRLVRRLLARQRQLGFQRVECVGGRGEANVGIPDRWGLLAQLAHEVCLLRLAARLHPGDLVAKGDQVLQVHLLNQDEALLGGGADGFAVGVGVTLDVGGARAQGVVECEVGFALSRAGEGLPRGGGWRWWRRHGRLCAKGSRRRHRHERARHEPSHGDFGGHRRLSPAARART